MNVVFEFLYQTFYRAPLRFVYRSFALRPLRQLIRGVEQRSQAAANAARDELGLLQQHPHGLEEQLGAQAGRLDALSPQTDELSGKIKQLTPRGVMIAPGARGYAAVTARDDQAYYRQVAESYQHLTNTFQYYRDLIRSFVEIDRVRLVPLCDLCSGSADKDRVIGLRHDIDADPQTAVRAARFLARQGICGSFYLLHTATYYGEFHHELFVRNPLLARWVQELIVAGCEIGLHNDVLGAHLVPGIDGAQALVTELNWLRSLGAQIKGTVGHNSAPTYGAENSEVFQGRRLWPRDARSPDGQPLPLESLCEHDLDLRYEGTFAMAKAAPETEHAAAFCAAREAASLRSESWMRQYLLDNPCCDWKVDFQFWLIGRDEWVAAGRFDGETMFEWKIGRDRLIQLARELPEGSRSVLVIHPVYVRD